MQGYTQTALIGDSVGMFFSDICFRHTDGSYMLDDPNKHTLDIDYPIREIHVSSDSAVEGIEVTYSLANSVGTTTLNHGCRFAEADRIVISAHETLAGVFGHAGFHAKLERKLINSIGFVIFDRERGFVRISGPFGNSASCDGEAFYVSDVIAFGGFAQTETSCLSGLFLIQRPMTF